MIDGKSGERKWGSFSSTGPIDELNIRRVRRERGEGGGENWIRTFEYAGKGLYRSFSALSQIINKHFPSDQPLSSSTELVRLDQQMKRNEREVGRNKENSRRGERKR